MLYKNCALQAEKVCNCKKGKLTHIHFAHRKAQSIWYCTTLIKTVNNA